MVRSKTEKSNDTEPKKLRGRKQQTQQAIEPVPDSSAETSAPYSKMFNSMMPMIRPPRGVSSPYVLSGLAYCSKCGAAMIGTAAKSGKYLYYECDNRFKKGKDSCIGLRLGKEMVENSVLEKIQENIITKENLMKLVHLINVELLETAGRLEKQLEQIEKELTRISGKLTKLYVALESGKVDMDDLAPRIKELRACQHELQQQRDSIISRMESDEPEKLEEDKAMSYVGELEEVLCEKSFLQQKAFLRRFVKRIELNPEGFVMDYAIPLPADKNRTSTREVLYFNKDGSGE